MSSVAHSIPARRRRVIINTDAKNEADDQFAIVHGVLTEMFDVRGLIAAHFGTRRTAHSRQESRQEIELLLDLLGQSDEFTVADGAPHAIPDEATPLDSPGARLIIAESKQAAADDPLYIAFLGPLTDMASAILLDREIVHRHVIVIWIGGIAYDRIEPIDQIEFNLSNDIAAANVVFSSGITIWQVPRPVYSGVSVSYAELDEKIAGTSRLADYLISQLVEWNATWHREPIESRSLGDSPAIALMLYPHSGRFRTVPAPRFSRDGRYLPGSGQPVQVCESVDVRFLLEDMFAKLRRFGREHR